MRYPMWRRNTDGTEIVVYDKAEAYAEPDRIARFMPDKMIHEQIATAEHTTEPEAEDGLQDEEIDYQEEVTEQAAPRKRGRPRKDAA